MGKQPLEKTTGQIQSAQPRDTGNIGYTRNRKKTTKVKSTTYIFVTVILFCTRCPPYIRTPTFQLK
jgi:hypothetical protein